MTVGRGALRARSSLLVVQIALSVVLLVAAGLVVRSFQGLRRVDLAFRPARVLSLTVQPQGTTQQPNVWMDQFLTSVRTLPGVEDAGAVYLRPLMLGPIGQGVLVRLEGQPETREAAEANPVLNHQIATPGYFETMRIPLRAGRLFTNRDTRDAPRVAIVGESTARGIVTASASSKWKRPPGDSRSDDVVEGDRASRSSHSRDRGLLFYRGAVVPGLSGAMFDDSARAVSSRGWDFRRARAHQNRCGPD